METEIGGKSLWQDVLILIVGTTGKKRGRNTPDATTMTRGLPPANTMTKVMTMKKKNPLKWKCEECVHSSQETTDDVACCNCCEDGEFFEEYKDEYTLADLGHNWW
jgi:hypothetical protein